MYWEIFLYFFKRLSIHTNKNWLYIFELNFLANLDIGIRPYIINRGPIGPVFFQFICLFFLNPRRKKLSFLDNWKRKRDNLTIEDDFWLDLKGARKSNSLCGSETVKQYNHPRLFPIKLGSRGHRQMIFKRKLNFLPPF